MVCLPIFSILNGGCKPFEGSTVVIAVVISVAILAPVFIYEIRKKVRENNKEEGEENND
jgi:hypothetical protein